MYVHCTAVCCSGVDAHPTRFEASAREVGDALAACTGARVVSVEEVRSAAVAQPPRAITHHAETRTETQNRPFAACKPRSW